jgi:hypothetical protein
MKMLSFTVQGADQRPLAVACQIGIPIGHAIGAVHYLYILAAYGRISIQNPPDGTLCVTVSRVVSLRAT